MNQLDYQAIFSNLYWKRNWFSFHFLDNFVKSCTGFSYTTALPLPSCWIKIFPIFYVCTVCRIQTRGLILCELKKPISVYILGVWGSMFFIYKQKQVYKRFKKNKKWTPQTLVYLRFLGVWNLCLYTKTCSHKHRHKLFCCLQGMVILYFTNPFIF